MKYVIFSTFSLKLYSLTPLFINLKKYIYIINIITFIMMIISLKIHKYYDNKEKIIITINILLELFFNLYLIKNNTFFMFSTKLLEFIFSIHLNEIICSNKKSAMLLSPYILWNFILTLFTTTLLFFINF